MFNQCVTGFLSFGGCVTCVIQSALTCIKKAVHSCNILLCFIGAERAWGLSIQSYHSILLWGLLHYRTVSSTPACDSLCRSEETLGLMQEPLVWTESFLSSMNKQITRNDHDLDFLLGMTKSLEWSRPALSTEGKNSFHLNTLTWMNEEFKWHQIKYNTLLKST